MQVKDYYSILELKPSASQAEIKKAFRRLAQELHPDKNDNDPYKATLFAQAKEAYDVLTNPAKKEYYLQQRWYSQSMGQKLDTKTISPATILKQTLELYKYVSTLDVHRMDRSRLTSYIINLISDDTIQQLKNFDEPDVNKTIIIYLLKTIKPLRLQQVDEIAVQLLKFADNDTSSKQKIDVSINEHRKKEKEKTIQPLIIIIITILMCLLIYLASR